MLICLSFRLDVIDPDASTVAVDDVENLHDFDDLLPAFPNLQNNADIALDLSDDSGFIGASQELVCPCCLQELDDVFP